MAEIKFDATEMSSNSKEPQDLYLKLLTRALTGALHEQVLYPVAPTRGLKKRVFTPIQRLLASQGFVLARSMSIGPHSFAQSPPWPPIPTADTMIGPRGLQNIRECVEDVLQQDVPGDLIEAGVWRGGATLFMRALLAAHGDSQRTVWLADSFRGLPTPAESGHSEDVGDEEWAKRAWFNVSLESVRRTFERYDLLDERVQFLVGWFADTLPTAPIERLSVIRLDADMYGSTIEALTALYPKLSKGGYVIVDDYGWTPNARAAVDDFRHDQGITDELMWVDTSVVYWRRGE